MKVGAFVRLRAGNVFGSLTTLPFKGKLRALAASVPCSFVDVQVAQRGRLEKLLRHACRTVPFYRSLVSSGEKQRASRTGAGVLLECLPIVERTELHASRDAFLSRERGKVISRTSGGSTGEPVRVFLDARYLGWNRASKVLFDAWAGYHPGQPKAVLWGAREDTRPERRPVSVLARALRNEEWFDAYNMSAESAVRYLDRMRTRMPRLLLGYAESLDALARTGAFQGIPAPPVKAVMSSAGTLFPDMRERIGSYFNAPVFNRYGAREVGDVAAECSAHEGLHVNPLTHYVELLRPDGSPAGPGETGEVVVTLLTNYAMPLIRYRIGDIATWAEGPCSCGCAWPLLKQVEGRVTDHFISMSGDLIHGGRLRTLLFEEDWIARYQWIQETRHLTRLLVVLRSKVTADEVSGRVTMIQRAATEVLGNNVDVRIEFVSTIQPGPTGKYRFTISHVHQ